MTTVAIVLALAASAVGVIVFAGAVGEIVSVVRLGRPAADRGDRPAERWKHLLTETLGHTRMLQWTGVGVAHWFVFVAFGALFFTLVTAYGQLFDPRFALPVIGHWVIYEWASEIIAWAGLIVHRRTDAGAAERRGGAGGGRVSSGPGPGKRSTSSSPSSASLCAFSSCGPWSFSSSEPKRRRRTFP